MSLSEAPAPPPVVDHAAPAGPDAPSGSEEGEGRPDGIPAAPPARRALGPATAVALAAAAWLGAVVGRPVPIALVALAAVAAVVTRRPWALVVPVALAASVLAVRAEAGLEPPPRAPAEGVVTLVTDPEDRWGEVEAIGRLDGRRVLVRASGPAAEVVGARLAGERVRATGRLGPPPADAPWLRARHVAGVLDVRTADPGPPADVPWRVANRLRRALTTGSAHLDEDRASLYVGLLLGDDRGQSPALTDDFRGSGLTHLLAVSGQNVVFVLALVAPVLGRLPLGARCVGGLAVLGLFVVLTRAEPSVLRAVAMAAGALVATARGRPTSGLHLLGLAVTACILVDPLLVDSVGFHLSVAATAGILVIGPRLAVVLPGPDVLRLPLAVTASAQLAVAPLLVATFAALPVAALPANLVAAPAAAVVLTWGLPAGLIAGIVGPPVAGVLHLPTGLALSWLAGVARLSASLPLGQLTAVHVAVVSVGLLVVLLPDRQVRWRRWCRVVAGAVILVTLAQPGLALARPPAHSEPVDGVGVWRAGGATVVVVAPSTGPTAVLEGMRRAGVRRVDLVVVGPGVTAVEEVDAARHRAPVAAVVWVGRDPPGTRRIGALEVEIGDAGARVRSPAAR